jgi:DNA-binding transcriptional regulator YbjK
MGPTDSRPGTSERRTLIADRAIAVLATRGARGLTHRAVDEEADLPAGSTSYYFRTRQALVEAANTRLVELDTRDVAEASRAGAAGLLAHWTAPSYRPRLIARFELFLEATRNPIAMQMIQAPRHSFLAAGEQAFRAAGAADAVVSAAAFVAAIEGLLISDLVGPRRSQDELAKIVRTLFVALSAPGSGGPPRPPAPPAGGRAT